MHLFSLIRYHSKIIGLYLGRFPVVAIYDFNIAKEVFSREDLTGRPDNFAYRFRSLGKRQGKNSIIQLLVHSMVSLLSHFLM